MFECLRKVFLSAVLVFCVPGSWLQIVVGLLFCLFSLKARTESSSGFDRESRGEKRSDGDGPNRPTRRFYAHVGKSSSP